MAKIYPPTDQFRFLSPDEQAARLDAAEDMLALMQFWRGDPRRSSWQEGFLAEMVRRIDLSKGKYKVSPKEWDKFWEIRDLMVADPSGTDDEDDA